MPSSKGSLCSVAAGLASDSRQFSAIDGAALQPLTTVPPLGCRTCPVIYDASSEARNT